MRSFQAAAKLVLILALVGLLATGCSLLPSAYSSSGNDLTEASGDTVTISRTEYERLQRYGELDELMKLVEQYYYIEPDTDAMVEMAERGLLAGLDDIYTYYYNPEEYANMWADDEGDYAGIGIQISASYLTQECTISRVFSNSPALDAGLKKGDVLTKVEELDVSTSTLNDAVSIMRGEVGTTVHVQVRRGDEALEFDIPRAQVHVNWVSSCMLENHVGYILLYEFSGDCSSVFTEQLNALLDQGATSLIIDLRDNPGGWVDDAVKIADLFLPEGPVTYLEDRAGQREYYNATEGALDIPLVVMLNGNSASASEVFSGALQDDGVATIVGTQSYGKGIVQYVMPVGTKGAGVQITAAQYYTPKGRSVHHVGITPDVTAELPEGDTGMYELGDMNDPQLQKAFEVVQQIADGSFVKPVSTELTESTDSESDNADTQAEEISADFTFRVS